MLHKCFVWWFIVISCRLTVWAQVHYLVFLTDKQGSNPDFSDFHPSAITRRQKHGIAWDSTDLPVSRRYLDQLSNISDSILVVSRWLNVVYLQGNSETEKKLKQLSFVKTVLTDAAVPMTNHTAVVRTRLNQSAQIQTILKYQTSRMQGQLFREHQLTGKGIRIAVFDAGFYGCDRTKELQHLFENRQIDTTYDFVRKQSSVWVHSNHGTKVLSCIAGKSTLGWLGLAPEATFLLARTEGERWETYQEELNWLA
ncbi:MAG: hypothetical protein NZ108_06380, partial [Bacteroidia bacterium]|nr:hypothetical protein [Bacteroidia bacterium]